jgi:hypothetical protein
MHLIPKNIYLNIGRVKIVTNRWMDGGSSAVRKTELASSFPARARVAEAGAVEPFAHTTGFIR